MQGLSSIKAKISEMASISLKMWELTYKTFMEHDLNLLFSVLEDKITRVQINGDVSTGRIFRDSIFATCHCEGAKRLRGEAEANSQPRNTRFLRFARNRLRNPFLRLLRPLHKKCTPAFPIRRGAGARNDTNLDSNDGR